MARACSSTRVDVRHDRARLTRRLFLLALCLCGGLGVREGHLWAATATARVRLHWTAAPGVQVQVSGLQPPQLAALSDPPWSPEQWQQLLRVSTTATNLLGPNPAMAGTYLITNGTVMFRPQFPIVPGVQYRAVLDLARLPGAAPALTGLVKSQFTLQPATPGAATRLDHIYPSAAVLPENQLKFYLHFSAPMRRGHIYDYIHLREESGKEVELPFLQIDEELWSPDFQRLTLIIDPGRIKRGVRPLEEIGPALQAGHRYRLVIDAGWEDAAGQPLAAAAQKVFAVGPPDRTPPDPAQWKLEPPRAGRRTPLRVLLPKPMDHALLLRLPLVVDESGRAVRGVSSVDHEEQRWSFTPDERWLAGHYALVIPTLIEDLAGNNIGKPFDVDVFEHVEAQLRSQRVDVPFQVR